MKITKGQSHEPLGSEFVINLPSIPRPAFTDGLKWPRDITQLPAHNLSDLLGKYTALKAYALDCQAKALTEELRIIGKLESAKTAIYIANPSIAHIEKWRRDQKMDSDTAVKRLKHDQRFYKMTQIQAESFVKIYESYIHALSRELSRKMASFDGMKHSKYQE